MKKIYFLLIALCFFTTVNAQIVNIPDANFKQWLLNARPNTETANVKIDVNNDGEIQKSEALSVNFFGFFNSNASSIISLEGIENFTNLKTLYCIGTKITSLNLNSLKYLSTFSCNGNN